jgi:arylsulfatase A-like enzyme
LIVVFICQLQLQLGGPLQCSHPTSFNQNMPQMKTSILVLLLMTPITLFAETVSPTDKPNIIVILADDLGYHDLGFQGSQRIKTPHLDQLAAGGTIFTDAHTTASVCSPSRAGFMTGRYQQRFGHEANVPPPAHGMDTSEYTLGQAFQSLGYSTFLVGKWHLGDPDRCYPTRRGFDEFWGLREGSRRYWYDESKSDKLGSPHAIEHNGEQVKFEGFLTDRFTDEAIRMAKSSKNPFFLFLSYTAPHAPLEAEKADLDRANQDAYVALVQNMDDNIGRLIASLEEQGIRDNTLIWFFSDNGGVCASASNVPLNGKKGIKFEGGQRVPFIANWPNHVPAGKTFHGLTSTMDIFPTSFKLAGGKTTPRPLDGVDLMPFLTKEATTPPHQNLFWKKLEGSAVRSGNWKMIQSEGLPPMLYNLQADLSEYKNLADQRPNKVKELQSLYQEWDKQTVPAQWGEAARYVEIRRDEYIRFRDSDGPLKLNGPRNKKNKKTK